MTFTQQEAEALIYALAGIRREVEQHLENELGPYWRSYEVYEGEPFYGLITAFRDYERILFESSLRKLDNELEHP